MVSITLSVPDDIRKLMKEFPEVNWSALVRKTIIDEVKRRELKKELLEGLKKDKDLIDWSVDLIRKGRQNENNS